MGNATSPSEASRLPHDDAAERAVLGAAILREDATPLRQVRDHLYSRRHCSIADAAIEVADSGGVPEIVAVKARLEHRGELSQVGGPGYLARLIDEVPRCANIDSYVNVIRNLAWRRAVMLRSQGLMNAVESGDSDRDVLELLTDLADERPAGRTRVEPIDLYSSEVTPAAPRWFVEHLFPRPGLVLVWAVPSGGKTFLLLRIAHELLFSGRDLLLGHPDLRVIERPQRVMWIATEETAERLRYRADMVLRDLNVSARALQFAILMAVIVR